MARSNVKVAFNDDAFENVEREVQRVFALAVDELRPLSVSHRGKPVAVVEREVQRVFKRHGFDLPSHDVREYAEAISSGVEIKMKE